MFATRRALIWNTLLYCGVAATVDALIGTAVAYLMLRTSVRGGKALDFLASASLAVPGVVLGIGYLRIFKGMNVPFTTPPCSRPGWRSPPR